MPENPALPTAERLLALADSLAGRPVLMLVDVVADHYVFGSPKRISREAPILILRYEGEAWVLGGGANAVANVRALGGEPLPLGLLGDDESGERLRDELDGLGVTTEGLITQAGYRTPTKTRILGGERSSVRQQVARYDIESRARIGEEELEQFRARLADWSGRAKVALLSDYGYGAVLPELVGEIRAALDGPGSVLCDSRYRLEAFAGGGNGTGMDGATPNQEEVEALLGAPLEESGGVAEGGRRLRERLGAEVLLMTRGSQGMALFDGRIVAHIPVHGTGQVADVTGAGDTVIGTFALARAAGASALEAAFIANYAAGIVVHKPGTAVPTVDEIRRAIETDPGPLEQARIESY